MDLIIHNAKIYTMSDAPQLKFAEAVAVAAGKIQAVGTNEEILVLQQKKTVMVDAHGRAVLPGFNDSHLHFLKAGIAFNMVDLSQARSIDDIVEIGKDFIQKNHCRKGDWILGRGWNQIYLKEQRMPNRRDLDRISQTHPVVFTRICEHTISANSIAIQTANVSSKTPQPQGGRIDIDEDGEVAGIFRDSARNIILGTVGDPDVDELKKIITMAAERASAYGITSIQTDDFWTLQSRDFKKVITAYKNLAAERKLNVRVNQQCLFENLKQLNTFLKAGFKTGDGNLYFKIGPCKAFSDGAMGGYTAYLTEPYSDKPSTCGVPIHTQKELDTFMRTAVSNGMDLVAHAIGNKAMHMCLQGFDKARAAVFGKIIRCGIIHAHAADEELLDRIADEAVHVLADPVVLNDDIHMVMDRLGKERIRHAYPYKTLLNRGATISLASDWPVCSLNPMKNIYVAATRKDYNGYPEKGFFPQECLSVEEAVRAYTRGSAYASREENIKGSIEVGKLADIVILSHDIFNIETEKLLGVSVVLTFLGGKKVFEKGT